MNARIKYTPAGGSEQTLTLTYPIRQIPGYSKNAVRHENLSTAGIRESVLERIEHAWTVQIDFVPMSDLAAWQAFLDHALTGADFDYYPEGSAVATSYLLEDTDALVVY